MGGFFSRIPLTLGGLYEKKIPKIPLKLGQNQLKLQKIAIKLGKISSFGPNLAKKMKNGTIEVGGFAALRIAHGSTQHI